MKGVGDFFIYKLSENLRNTGDSIHNIADESFVTNTNIIYSENIELIDGNSNYINNVCMTKLLNLIKQ